MPIGFAPLDYEPSIGMKMLSAASGACTAEMFTFPMDTAKVRLQIQGESASLAPASARYRGLVGTLRLIGAEEGVRGLYGGLTAGLQRQCCFASLRIGLYQPAKASIASLTHSHENHVLVRILAGALTGGFAVMIAQPTDVVKVRMQAQNSGKGVAKRYASCWAAYRHIIRHEGVKGLWKGFSPNVARNAIINASELVSYDIFKTQLLSRGLLSDNMPCHLLSACGAGFVATVIGSPVDLVKTRFINAKPGTYRGVLDCALQVARQGGLRTFYNGFLPAFMRMASFNICMFVTFEQFVRGFSHASQVLHTAPAALPTALAASIPSSRLTDLKNKLKS